MSLVNWRIVRILKRIYILRNNIPFLVRMIEQTKNNIQYYVNKTNNNNNNNNNNRKYKNIIKPTDSDSDVDN